MSATHPKADGLEDVLYIPVQPSPNIECFLSTKSEKKRLLYHAVVKVLLASERNWTTDQGLSQPRTVGDRFVGTKSLQHNALGPPNPVTAASTLKPGCKEQIIYTAASQNTNLCVSKVTSPASMATCAVNTTANSFAYFGSTTSSREQCSVEQALRAAPKPGLIETSAMDATPVGTTRGLDATPVGTTRGLDATPVGTTRGLDATPVGTTRGLDATPVGTTRGLDATPVGTTRGLDATPVGTTRGLDATPVGTTRGLDATPVGTTRGLDATPVGTTRGLDATTRNRTFSPVFCDQEEYLTATPTSGNGTSKDNKRSQTTQSTGMSVKGSDTFRAMRTKTGIFVNSCKDSVTLAASDRPETQLKRSITFSKRPVCQSKELMPTSPVPQTQSNTSIRPILGKVVLAKLKEASAMTSSGSAKRPRMATTLRQSQLTFSSKGKSNLAVNVLSKAATMNDQVQPKIRGVTSSENITLNRTPSMTSSQCNALAELVTTTKRVAVTLYFSDGSSLLRPAKKSRGQSSPVDVEGVSLAIPTNQSNGEPAPTVSFYLLPMDRHLPEVDAFTKKVLLVLFTREDCQNMCYNAQELMTTIIDHYNLNLLNYHRWSMFDPLVGAWLVDSEHPPNSFTDLLERYSVKDSCKISSEKQLCEDLLKLEPVSLVVHQKLQENELLQLYSYIEMKIIPILSGMEAKGVVVQSSTLLRYSDIISEEIKRVETKVHHLAGHSFLLSSAQQLRTVLYDELKLDQKCTKPLTRTSVKKHMSTSESVLQQLKDFHPLPSLVLQYRQLIKLKSTYIDGVVPHVADGTLRSTWLHTGTATGRIASANPNIQAFPKQPLDLKASSTGTVVEDVGVVQVDIRGTVRSRPDFSFIVADFRSIELRMLAHLCQDDNLLRVLRDPALTDIFKSLSSEWLEKAECDITSVERERTKRVVYAVIYGAGKEKLAEILDVHSSISKDLMDGFMSKFKGIHSFIHQTIEQCRKKKFVQTILGRRRYLPNISSSNYMERAHSERQAVNFCVQGSAADLCKCSMIESVQYLSQECPQANLLIHVHDELVFEVPSEQAMGLACNMRHILQQNSLLHSFIGPLKCVRMSENMAFEEKLRSFLKHYEALEATVGQEGEEGYYKEFMELKGKSQKYRENDSFPTDSGKLPCNKKKNRFKDILPFEHTRVALHPEEGVEGSDYINANYITNGAGEVDYIAAQGPLPHTVNDFWRMLWYHNIEIVCMACREVEMGKNKCERYWTEPGESKMFGPIKVTTLNEVNMSNDFIIRDLQAECQGEQQLIRQYHYTAWPDHLKPTSIYPILRMIEMIHEFRQKKEVPIVAHCSAGCGRTGTIITMDIIKSIVQSQDASKDVDVYKTVEHMRTQRPAMVQAKDQYHFVYQAAASLARDFLEGKKLLARPPLPKSKPSPKLEGKEPTHDYENWAHTNAIINSLMEKNEDPPKPMPRKKSVKTNHSFDSSLNTSSEEPVIPPHRKSKTEEPSPVAKKPSPPTSKKPSPPMVKKHSPPSTSTPKPATSSKSPILPPAHKPKQQGISEMFAAELSDLVADEEPDAPPFPTTPSKVPAIPESPPKVRSPPKPEKSLPLASRPILFSENSDEHIPATPPRTKASLNLITGPESHYEFEDLSNNAYESPSGPCVPSKVSKYSPKAAKKPVIPPPASTSKPIVAPPAFSGKPPSSLQPPGRSTPPSNLPPPVPDQRLKKATSPSADSKSGNKLLSMFGGISQKQDKKKVLAASDIGVPSGLAHTGGSGTTHISGTASPSGRGSPENGMYAVPLTDSVPTQAATKYHFPGEYGYGVRIQKPQGPRPQPSHWLKF